MATIPTYMTYRGTKTAGSGLIKTGLAASEIPFGAFVTRAADGTVQAMLSGTKYDYIGVAVDDQRKQIPYDGFYAAGKKVPIVTSGIVNVWLLGGETVDTGNFVIAAGTLGAGTEPLGIVQPEGTATTRTTASIGRVTETSDVGDTDYDQTITSYSGDVVTFASSTVKGYLDLVDGDYVVIDSNEHAEVNRVVDAAYGAATVKMEKALLAGHTTAPKMYKLLPLEIELI